MNSRIVTSFTAIALIAAMALATTSACAQRNNRKARGIKTERTTANAQRKATSTHNSGAVARVSGTVDPNRWEGDKKTSVTFTAFPTTLAEWKAMQSQLGGEPQGAVALQVMAFELYRNNRTDGEAALRLNNTSTNYNSTVGRLREIMGKDQYYAHPYIAWAMLKGATPENGYTVRPPYTIDMKVDPNKRYQESQLLRGTVIYLLIDSKGWDTNWRGVEVVKPQGSDYYVVSNCPAMYTQCKQALK